MTRTTLVTGGTGTLGRPVVDGLRAAGHTVRVASRRGSPMSELPYQWSRVDYRDGAGLAAALDGVDTVVHCANSMRHTSETDRQVVDAAVRARVGHFVHISIVGVDRIPYSYYRAKLATERRLENSGLPYTILRATQFHDLVRTVLAKATALPLAPLPAGWRFQPVEVREVAERLVALADGRPVGRAPDFGGPQVRTLPDLAARYRESLGRTPRPVLPVPVPGGMAAAMRRGENLTPAHADGRVTFEEHLARL
ncbi:hypothetical protein CTZ27_10410 [Streptomyces griseocarneus]|nr:hypothetical protein CTZ27_10410 [Streptomyces griseocarneus]